MSWTSGARILRTAALSAAAAGLAACVGPAGESALMPLHGESIEANFLVQADRSRAGRPLARDFAASAEPTVTFAFDDASLDARAQAILDDQARWLLDHPGVRMTVTGHTDLVGPERYNMGLGLRRAESARAYLIARGVPPDMLEAVESLGERDPVVPTPDRERRNRRAVTWLAGRGAGGGLDGAYAARLYNAYQAGRVDTTEAEPIAVN